jgi:hypothetical protein
MSSSPENQFEKYARECARLADQSDSPEQVESVSYRTKPGLKAAAVPAASPSPCAAPPTIWVAAEAKTAALRMVGNAQARKP